MSQRRARHERQQHRAAGPAQRLQSTSVRLVLATAALLALAALAATLALGRGGTPTAATPAAGAEAAAVAASANSPLELSGTDPVTGKRVSLAAYAGKPIVLNMWASWCTGCYAEARALAAFARTHPQAQVVGIDIQDTRQAAKAFYRRYGWRHPSIFDPSGSIAAQLGLQGLPTTLFLDRHHRVVAKIVGETTLAGFDAGYQKARA
jgi:thiol-disulfide isomerase/thioredoxin